MVQSKETILLYLRKCFLTKMKVILAILALLTTGLGAYTQYLKSQQGIEKSKREYLEIFLSNYQDKVECKFAVHDSLLMQRPKCK